MSVLFVATEFPPVRFGGSAESVRLLADALGARGGRVTVLTPAWEGRRALTRVQTPWGEVVRFPIPHAGVTGLPSERVFLRPGFLWATTRAVWREAKFHSVVHVQDRRLALAGFLGAHLAHRPAILTLRDMGLLCPLATCLLWEGRTIPRDCGQARLWVRCAPWFHRTYHGDQGRIALVRRRLRLALRFAWLALERRVIARYDRIACVSRGLARHYEAIFPGLDALPSPAPLGPPPSHTCTKADPPVVLFVGKPSLGKGWPDFVDAGAILTDWGRSNGVRFVHVGPPAPERNRWIDELGVLSPVELEAWYCRATLVAVPSRNADALPRVGLEALAHGTPVVGTRSGGIEDLLIETMGGILVEPCDPAALARVIRKLFAPEVALVLRAMGESAKYQTALRFGAAAVAEVHERVYAALRSA